MTNIHFDTSNFPIPANYSEQFYSKLHTENFQTWRANLFNGEPINTSENRAALHTALRTPIRKNSNNNPNAEKIKSSLIKMTETVTRLHSKKHLGSTGKPITDIIHLGVGGSYLGPRMVCHALDEFHHTDAKHLTIHFSPSMDGTDLDRLCRKLNPETSLFIIASKTFSTLDTMQNSEAAKSWLIERLPSSEQEILNTHFIGCSAKPEIMSQWGIHPDNQLLFWDWVGGRYSIWSVIGLPIALLIGMQQFEEFLAGAHNIDDHFLNTPLEENIPVSMAKLSTWAAKEKYTANAILPYDGRLSLLAEHLQQLIMESNGKSISVDGNPIQHPTCPIVFGGTGTNVQHSFFQLLHQGTQKVFCDFILFKNRYSNQQTPDQKFVLQHKSNIKQALAQSLLLFHGDYLNMGEGTLPSNQSYPGGTPSSLLIMDTLTPYSLGQLLALYEHKTFVEAFIWNINPFDQWGVQLGKIYADSIDLNKTIYTSNNKQLNHLLSLIRASE